MIDPDVYDGDEAGGMSEQLEEIFQAMVVREKTSKELQERVARAYDFIQIDLGRDFNREVVFFTQDIRKELGQLVEAYDSDSDKALELCKDLYKRWGDAVSDKRFRPDFAGQICDIYRDLHDFIYARHKSVS